MIWAFWLGCPKVDPRPGTPVVLPPDAVGGADIRWYDVSGHDVRSLREALRLASPLDENGERTLGRTQWNVTWAWDGEGSPCRVAQVVVDLSVLVWLPRWTPEPGTDPELVSAWRGYLGALATHERGHVSLVSAQTAQLDDVLRVASCGDVDVVGALALDAIRALNHDYDVATEHGRLQGARFWTATEWGASVESEAGFAE